MEPESTTYWRRLETFSQSTIAPGEAESLRVPGLTILAHPEPRRVGERTVLTALASWQEVPLSRLEPRFAAPGQGKRRPLADAHLSRSPIKLTPVAGGGLRLDPTASRTRLAVDGEHLPEARTYGPESLERGLILLLSDRVVLLLHFLDPVPPQDLPRFGLVGESARMLAVRQQIARVADLSVPALIRGETGTGKELVARAIHQASQRARQSFVAVNMGAVPPTLAAAELFGSVKGAFTGADRRRTGHFSRAHLGTLFLDEIGETPAEVQVLLLRALETGIVQPVGSESQEKVDVRILAATDAQLETEIEAGRFRAPLLHRLSGFEIRLPPLRERLDDLGRLLHHFLYRELEELGETWRLAEHATREPPWLPAPLVARLATFPWPGNVRQLRNVARQLVISSRGEEQLLPGAEIEALLASPEESDVGAEAGADIDTGPLPVQPAAAPAAASAEVRAEGPVLKTLLVTDLVGSTRMVQRLGDHQAYAVLARHDHLVRALLGEYEGTEIDKSDGFLLLFERPVDAVGFALEFHEGLAELAAELGVEIEARVGIHVGEVFLHRNEPALVARGAKPIEIEGLAKPMVARLMRLALGRQTLVSRSAFDLARQAAQGDHPLAEPGVRWLHHGPFRLRGLEEEIEVFEVGLPGSAPLRAPDAGLAGPGTSKEKPAATYRSPEEVGEEELLAALRDHAFRLQPAAAALGVSRTSLYALIDRSERVRKAGDLGAEEILAARESCGGDLDAMAERLEVSRKGLSRRMSSLGLAK